MHAGDLVRADRGFEGAQQPCGTVIPAFETWEAIVEESEDEK